MITERDSSFCGEPPELALQNAADMSEKRRAGERWETSVCRLEPEEQN